MPSMHKFPGMVAALAALAAVACRGPESSSNEAVAPSPANETNIAEALPRPEPALDRNGFLRTIASVASAHTVGTDDRAMQSALDGRRFAIRVRFGCDGPAPNSSTAALRWTQAQDGKSFGIFAKPDLSLADERLKDISDQTIEAVEGFCIPRPWENQGACPNPAADDEEAALPAPQLVGIAQYFTAEDLRCCMRVGTSLCRDTKGRIAGRTTEVGAYFAVSKGDFEAWPGGKVVRCSRIGPQPAARLHCLCPSRPRRFPEAGRFHRGCRVARLMRLNRTSTGRAPRWARTRRR